MIDSFLRPRQINTFEVINGDPLLSYFKSHFVIRKVYFPRVMTIEYFADIVPQGFGLQKEFNNGVYIVQICHVYDEQYVDISIAFRRDEVALQIARGPMKFIHDNKESNVEISTGFQCWVESIKLKERENEQFNQNFTRIDPLLKRRQSQNIPSQKVKQEEPQPQSILKRKSHVSSSSESSSSSSSSSSSQSSSSSRSRSRNLKKKRSDIEKHKNKAEDRERKRNEKNK